MMMKYPCEEEEEKEEEEKEKEGEQSTNLLIFHCKILRNQRNEVIKHIKTLVAISLRRMKRYSVIIYKSL